MKKTSARTNAAKRETDYKHGDRIKFKGLEWQYDKYYGEWHSRNTLSLPHTDLQVIFSWCQVWRVGNEYGSTPLKALDAWVSETSKWYYEGMVDLDRERKDLEKKLRSLESRSWKRRGITKGKKHGKSKR